MSWSPREAVEYLTAEFGSAIAAWDRPAGGQQAGVPNCDFYNVPPSVRQRIRWWHRELKRTLEAVQDPTLPEYFECPECGPALVDDDGCCHNCGADAEIKMAKDGHGG